MTADSSTTAADRMAKAQAAAAALAQRSQGKKPAAKKTAAKKTTPRKTAAQTRTTAAREPGSASTPGPTPAGRQVRAAKSTAPAEQEKPVFYSERINLTTTPQQKKMLKLAAVEDGIDTTARIRAMIALYEDDEKLRRRVDKLAQHWR